MDTSTDGDVQRSKQDRKPWTLIVEGTWDESAGHHRDFPDLDGGRAGNYI